MPWNPPSLQLKWGPYFRPDPAEQLAIVQLVQAAMGSGGTGERLITREIGVSKLDSHSVFEIENVEALLEKIDEERQEMDEESLDKKVTEAKELTKVMPAPQSASGKPGAAKSPPKFK